MLANDKPRPVCVPPGHDLRRELVIVAHPDRDRLQQVNDVELGGREAFDERGPAADQRRLFGVEPLVLEVALGVSDKQRRRIGDRKVAGPDHVVLSGAAGLWVSSQAVPKAAHNPPAASISRVWRRVYPLAAGSSP